jgi:Family of unknown function (DUF5318)
MSAPQSHSLKALTTLRDSIDYSLDRRATLLALAKGSASAFDACDADPYLRRAAKHHGDETERICPVCQKEVLRELRYVFGDQLGQYSGRIKSIPELVEMEREYGEFRVYTVEVCLSCGWNHLIYSYILGDGRYRKPPRRSHTVEDDDWVERKVERKAPHEKSWRIHAAALAGELPHLKTRYQRG